MSPCGTVGADVRHTAGTIVLQPVLEVYAPGGFTLWPVTAEPPPDGFLPLHGGLTPAQVGTALMRIAECNDIDPESDGRPPRPAGPLDAFLHGLLTMDDLFAPGGLRVTDTATGTTLRPGCCHGLDERRDWQAVLDGTGTAGFGHDPSPLAERDGEVIRLTVDADRADSPVMEVRAEDLRRLLAGAERDLTAFLHLTAAWTACHLPAHAAPVTAAVARALALPCPRP